MIKDAFGELAQLLHGDLTNFSGRYSLVEYLNEAGEDMAFYKQQTGIKPFVPVQSPTGAVFPPPLGRPISQ